MLGHDLGQPERAARLFGAADVLRESVGVPLPANERADHERYVDAVRAALGDESFAAAWDAGRALRLDEAIAEALALAQELAAELPDA